MLLTRNDPQKGIVSPISRDAFILYDFVQAVLICMAEAFSV